MYRDKQIEKMLKSCPCYHDGKCYSMISPDTCDGGCKYEMYAEALYTAGYCKSTDLAREIFEEIESRISTLEYRANTPRNTVKVEELKAQVNWVLHEVVPQTIAELKKKYIESEDKE